jgi:hypothetical protein
MNDKSSRRGILDLVPRSLTSLCHSGSEKDNELLNEGWGWGEHV